MNEAGYDLAVPGNNEGLTLSKNDLETAYGGARFEIIGSNLYESGTGRIPSWLKPYSILDREGVRIGFIGVTAYFPAFYNLLGWDIQEPFGSIRHWLKEVRERADVVVLISHLGIAHDRRIAEEISGIDVILGAHTHHLLEEPLRIGGTAILAAGKWGRYVGCVEMEYDREAGALVKVDGRVYPTEGEAEEPGTVRTIDAYESSSRTVLQEPAAVLNRPLPIHWHEESELGNLLAAGLRSWVGAEIGLVNAGQLLEGLPKGTVTRGELHRICPSPINPCSVNLKGSDLLTALEESLLPEFTEKPIMGFGFRGRFSGPYAWTGCRWIMTPMESPIARSGRFSSTESRLTPPACTGQARSTCLPSGSVTRRSRKERRCATSSRNFFATFWPASSWTKRSWPVPFPGDGGHRPPAKKTDPVASGLIER
ncbi:bifunctional metallophosphatase/5'-nucleotidase [Paenibacillus sp. CC-CFT747]|nr:bifunctional metallophosphatase/5'-nucleotidase [Paenibacillus sp. CC-CFT747]